jgi:Helix-turn-helix domain
MSYALVDRVFEIKGLDPTDSWMLAAICRHADDKGRSFPSVALLCKETRFKDRTVRDSIRHLAMHGFHSIERRSGTSNVYRVTLSEGVPCSTRTKCLRNTPAPRAVLHHVQTPPAPGAYESIKESVRENLSKTPAPRARVRKPPRRKHNSPSGERSERRTTVNRGPAPRAGVRKNRDCTGDCTACPVVPCPYYTTRAEKS